ncbi:MAG: FAD:protein FMN transferase [Pirellulales bacterium]
MSRAAGCSWWLLLLILSASLAGPWPAGLRGVEPCGAAAVEPALDRYEFQEVHMGAPIKIVLYAADEAFANAAAAKAFERIGHLDKLLSDYDPDSELSRLSRTAGLGQEVEVGRELWFVLSRAQKLAEATGGAFDVTVGPYVRLWRRARRQSELPDPARLAQARQAVGYRNLKLDPGRRTARLLAPGMRLDLGGIAMGYAADEALEVLAGHGVSRALIDASGDIVAGEAPPGRDGWSIAVAALGKPDSPPSRYVLLRHAAVTTSGDAFQFVEIDGVRYSHIVDPRTGLGLTESMSVTVVAADCMTADSLATAVCVLGPEKGLALIEDTAGAAGLLVRRVGDRVETAESSGFDRFEIGPMASPAGP